MNKKLMLFRNEKGQSLVEFALVMPVLMLILLGILEFGYLYNAQITLTSAAREGARVYAIKGRDETLISDAVVYTARNLDIIGDLSAMPQDFFTLTGDVKMAKVIVTCSIEPLVKFFVPPIVELSAEASMRVEYQSP